MDIPFHKTLLSSLLRVFGSLNAKTALLAAVSGGGDSTALLAALAGLREECGFRLYALHVDHGLRGEEGHKDAQAVQELCAALGVECVVECVKEGAVAERARTGRLGVEAAAREARLAAFRREASRLNAEAVLTAHTKDDALETTLMRVLRGAGPVGLSPLRQAARSGGLLLVKPLLSFSHEDCLTYLRQRGLSWREDSSNADTRFLRNRVRRSLIPLLDSQFPQWRGGIAGFAATQARVADFIADELERRKNEAWKNLPPLLREEAIFKAIDSFSPKDSWLAAAGGTDGEAAGEADDEADFEPDLPGRRNAAPRREAVRKLADSGGGTADMGAFRVEAGEAVRVITKKADGFALVIAAPGRYFVRNASFPLSITCFAEKDAPQTGVFFADLPLVVRQRYPGDSLQGGVRGYTHNGTSSVLTALDRRGAGAFISCGKDGKVRVRARENSGRPAGAAFLVQAER